MSLTEGMAEHWGNYLVSDPFRFRLLKKIIKKIVEVVKRYIPKRRKPVTLKIKMLGDLVRPISRIAEVRGNPSIPQFLIVPSLGDLQTPTESKFIIKGSPSFPVSFQAQVSGNTSHRVIQATQVTGSPVHKWMQRLSIEGERDLRKRLWTVLEDEE